MINAVFDKIVVEYLRKTKSSQGIFIPESAQDPQGYGRVLSIGDQVEAVNTKMKVGDILIFHTRAGMDLIHEKTVLKCIKYEEIYGILDDDDELISRLEPLVFKTKEKSSIIKPASPGPIVIA